MGAGVRAGGSTYAPWSLRQLVDDLRSGAISTAAAHERSQDRIAETEPDVRAWVVSDPAVPPGLLATGELHGVPFGVKDIIDVEGLPTRCGSALRADADPATDDAAIVTAWRRAGAVPVGKTVTTEFAFFSPGPTRNPAAPGRTPGGSSSGSAAAVAAGQVPLAIGSQTAGSVTRPASYCGTAALVTRPGRLPTDGIVGLSPTFDSNGIYAASVSDLALAWSALTGADDAAAAPTRDMRVLWWTAGSLHVVEDAMHAALDEARSRLVSAGVTVTDLPDEQLIAEATQAHPIVMAYEAARERAHELAVSDQLSEPLARLLRTGEATSDADYRDARGVLTSSAERLSYLMSHHDVVIGPAAPGVAPVGLSATGDPVLSRAWQGMGMPVAVVPGLTDPAGLPLGLQVVGADEDSLLRCASAVESMLRS